MSVFEFLKMELALLLGSLIILALIGSTVLCVAGVEILIKKILSRKPGR